MILLRPFYRIAHWAGRRFGRKGYRFPRGGRLTTPTYGDHLLASGERSGRDSQSAGSKRRGRRLLIKRFLLAALGIVLIWIVAESVRAFRVMEGVVVPTYQASGTS